MSSPDSGFRLDYEAIPKAIEVYDRTLLQIGIILNNLWRSGRIEPWAQDEVSLAMANHYNEQVFGVDGAGQSPYCTYGAIKAYQQGMVAARDTLQQTYDDYLRTEAEAEASFNRT